MPIQLLLDTREDRMQDMFRDRHPDIPFEVVPLEVGDVEVRHTDPEVRIIIERKTERDLSASLRDGRYHEQKARMLSTVAPHQCLYLIENPHIPTWSPNRNAACKPSSYAGAILHTMFRDGIHVAITHGLSDTTDWIATIYKKCSDNPHKMMGGERDASAAYVDCARIKTKKIENVDPATCYLLQLGQIPGISTKLAKSIADVYPTLRSLLRALETTHDSHGEKGCVEQLSKIPLIGAKKARVLLEYLRPWDESEASEEVS
jgi:crossover junction endonuclease MUS81